MVLGHHHPGWWEDLLHYKLLIIRRAYHWLGHPWLDYHLAFCNDGQCAWLLGQHHFHHTWERCNGNTLKSTSPISPTLGSARAHPLQLGREVRLNLPQLRPVLRINSTVNQLLCSVQVLGIVDFKGFRRPRSASHFLCPQFQFHHCVLWGLLLNFTLNRVTTQTELRLITLWRILGMVSGSVFSLYVRSNQSLRIRCPQRRSLQ